jgi:hypothetical protein
VFRGQYLPLSLSKKVFHILKKQKERKRKKKASAKQKQEPHKKIRSAVVRFYQACELI